MMTDNEQRAHDIALAITSVAFKSTYDAMIQTGIATQKEKIEINVSSDEFFKKYQSAYAKVLNHLNGQ